MNKTAYHDVIHKPGEGVLLEGRPDLFIPESDLQKIDKIADEIAGEKEDAKTTGKCECHHCGEFFDPRSGSGGKKQKYCTEECRRAADNERKANAPQRAQRAEAETSEGDDHPIEEIETFHGSIPRQLEIKVKSTKGESYMGNDVELQQEGHYGFAEETDTIIVSSQNVLRLVRMILWAHGFKTIKIAHSDNGMMWEDLNDGDEPGNHY